jgi:nucleoside-diphosphate-sugar epimerase
MRIMVAGATGVVGRLLVPLLREAGHEVAGTTRNPERLAALDALGAQPLVMDALDAGSVTTAVKLAAPDVVIHQLTDLAGLNFAGNARLRIAGTRHLVDAALAAGVGRMIAQSISWVVAPGDTPATESEPLAQDATPGVRELESDVAEMPVGVVLRYGLLYGPGTWFARDGLRADEARAGKLGATARVQSFVHVHDAALAAVAALGWPTGVVNVVDDEPAPATEWVPAFAAAVGAPEQRLTRPENAGRPISNAHARALGWSPQYPTWRTGFATL